MKADSENRKADFKETKKVLKKELIEIGIRSSFHGLNRVLTRHLWIQLLWSICMLASVGLCAYTVAKNIGEYASFGVNTLVQVLQEESANHPVTTICNPNPMITNEAFEYVVDYYSQSYNVTLVDYAHFYEMVAKKIIPDDLDWLFYRTFDLDFNITLRKTFGYSLEKQIIFSTANNIYLEYEEFSPIYHPKYGNCFVYNTGFLNNGKWVGRWAASLIGFGFEMVLITGVPNKKKVFNTNYTGIVVIIEDQNEPSLDKDGILVMPGSYADVAVSKSNSSKLPQPYSDCLQPDSINSVVANEMKRLTMTYQRRNCFTLCRKQQIIDGLGCYDMRYPRLFNATPCNHKASFEKMKTIERSFDSAECERECPFECDNTFLDYKVSLADYPNYYEFKYIQ